MTTTTPAARLAERAMLAELSISQWTARSLDRKITDEVNREHGAAADAGRYNKLLLDKTATAAIQTAANAARAEHYRLTLPWNDAGARILSARAFMGYTAAIRPHREAFERAVDDFIGRYDEHKDAARVRLNGMFREQDYPTRDQLARKFSFDVEVWPMPDASDFRADLTADQVDAIRTDIERRTKDALARATRDAWERIAERVGAMVERLSAYNPDAKTGAFRDSLVENVRDLVAVLPALNVTDDPALAAIAARMERELCDSDAEQLRRFADARHETLKSARDILASVSEYLA